MAFSFGVVPVFMLLAAAVMVQPMLLPLAALAIPLFIQLSNG